MNFTKRRKHIIGILIACTLLLIGKPMYDNGHTTPFRNTIRYSICGRSLICGIDLGDDMKGGHGLETGLAYEIMQSFASEHGCDITIKVGGDATDYMDSLQHGKIDMLITHREDAEGVRGIALSENITVCCAMAVNMQQAKYLPEINRWINSYTQTEEFASLQNIFRRQSNPIKLADKGIRRNHISPYDDLLKRYATELGWDWRMLAAVIYQESKFSINSQSHRGATGLMQVMPRTAEYYDIDNLHDPEQNLIAGTSHLKRLQNLYKGNDMSQQERIHFTLAAYNAGEGRIMDCRNLAKAQNLDPNIWEDVMKVIPQMREDSILVENNIKLGKFNGTETMAYVDNVMTLYSAICKICPENQ